MKIMYIITFNSFSGDILNFNNDKIYIIKSDKLKAFTVRNVGIEQMIRILGK